MLCPPNIISRNVGESQSVASMCSLIMAWFQAHAAAGAAAAPVRHHRRKMIAAQL
eukprot:COSAG01_NODE_470_length_16575_cov_5.572408_25_plen_55_part_00